jgi:hypothetical protein
MHYLIVFLVSLFLFTTNCTQKIHFVGMTEGQTTATVWVMEEVGGECGFTVMHQICMDTAWRVHSTDNYYEGDTTSAGKMIRDMHVIAVQHPVMQKDGKFNADPTMSFSKPKSNARWMEKFKDNYYSAWDWNKQVRDSSIVPPIFTGCTAELLYAAPRGLYVDYLISEVSYSPQTGILLICTQQQMMAPGMDTMHGFLVYRLKKKK